MTLAQSWAVFLIVLLLITVNYRYYIKRTRTKAEKELFSAYDRLYAHVGKMCLTDPKYNRLWEFLEHFTPSEIKQANVVRLSIHDVGGETHTYSIDSTHYERVIQFSVNAGSTEDMLLSDYYEHVSHYLRWR